jgi:hypothetical protein
MAGWLTQDALWLVSKTVSDKLRAHLLSQGIDGIPANNTAVFDVLQDHGILLPTAEGKAIWKATITSETGWSHSFTLLRLGPALIWEANEGPESFSGTVTVEMPVDETARIVEASADTDPAVGTPLTSSPTAPFKQDSGPADENKTAPNSDNCADEQSEVVTDLISSFAKPESTVTTPSPAVATDSANYSPTTSESDPEPKPTLEASPQTAAAQPSGEHFMTWLKKAIQSRKLIMNDVKALVHTVADTVFLVSPGVFQRYAQENPQIATWTKEAKQRDWQWIQKRFEKLQLHRKQPNGLNIWTCEVTGPRKSLRLHGYLLQSPSHLFDEIPPNNPYLTVSAD